jgi:hypothetical protein
MLHRRPFDTRIAVVIGVAVASVFLLIAAVSRATASPLPPPSSPMQTRELVVNAVREFMATEEFADQVFYADPFATIGRENRRLLSRSLTPGEAASFEAAFAPARAEWRVTVTWSRPDLEKLARFTFHVLDNGTIWYVGLAPCYPSPSWPDCG